jgi:hypothetical protein
MEIAEGIVGNGDHGPVVENAPIALLEDLQARLEVGVTLSGSEELDEIRCTLEHVVPPGASVRGRLLRFILKTTVSIVFRQGSRGQTWRKRPSSDTWPAGRVDAAGSRLQTSMKR